MSCRLPLSLPEDVPLTMPEEHLLDKGPQADEGDQETAQGLKSHRNHRAGPGQKAKEEAQDNVVDVKPHSRKKNNKKSQNFYYFAMRMYVYTSNISTSTSRVKRHLKYNCD